MSEKCMAVYLTVTEIQRQKWTGCHFTPTCQDKGQTQDGRLSPYWKKGLISAYRQAKRCERWTFTLMLVFSATPISEQVYQMDKCDNHFVNPRTRHTRLTDAHVNRIPSQYFLI